MQLLVKLGKGLIVLLMLFVIAACSAYYYWVKPKTNYPLLKVDVISHLHKYVRETSSLAYVDGQYWTTNDSGDGPYLYRINPDLGTIEGTVELTSSKNEDWESLAQDRENLYVFDCGNNKANRESRTIMKVSFAALLAEKYDNKDDATVAISNKRRFIMADKPDDLVPFIHDFDCEAAAVVADELWIFSKNWTDFESRLYRLPLMEMDIHSKAIIPLLPAQQISVEGLVTGADFDDINQRLVLLGYDNDMLSKQAFFWFIPVEDGELNWLLAQRFNLDVRGQWESVIWQAKDQILITAEATYGNNARAAIVKVPIL